MKQNKIKKGLSLILTLALVVGLLPVMPGNVDKVVAAGGSAPSITAYATKEQLMTSFDLDGSSDTVGKIVFGKNENGTAQEWYIAGSDSTVQNDNIMLFVTSPMVTAQREDDTVNKTDSSLWADCNYNGVTVTKVNVNHYGASDLRAKLKDMAASTAFFSATEQSLMQATTVNNNDTYNSCIYTTSDKLYLLYGSEMDTMVYIGGNNASIAISQYESGYGTNFFLRTSDTTSGDYILCYRTSSHQVSYHSINSNDDLCPATNINLSSVLFASSAKGATSGVTSGTITSGEAMSLRLAGTNQSVGSVYVDSTEGLILADIGSGATGTVSLVVQGNDGTNDWYYSKVITSKELIETSDIETELGISGVSLSNCQVWVEKTSDNVIYAVDADRTGVTTVAGVDVTIDAPEAEVELATTAETTTEGVASTAPSISWTYAGGTASGKADFNTVYTAELTLEENENAYFDAGIIASINGEPATVTVNADRSITVSYTFPATIKKGTGTLDVADSRYGEGFSIQPVSTTNDTSSYTVVYKELGASEDTYTNTKPTAVGDYTAKVTLVANAEYSEVVLTDDFSIIKANGSVDFTIANIYYKGTINPQVTSSTNDEDSAIIEYKITGAVDDAYSETVPTAVGSYTARITLPTNESYEEVVSTTSFSILKAEGTGEFSIANIYYGGKLVSKVLSDTNDADSAFVEYKITGAVDDAYSETVPTAVGSYTARVTIPASESYEEVVMTTSFSILKAEGTGEFSIADIYYGGKLAPQVVSKTNDASAAFIEYKLVGDDDSSYVSTAPTAVGSYTARVTMPSNESYNSVVLTTDFSIKYLPAPESEFEVSGTSGTNEYYTSPVIVAPPEGYLIADTLDGEYSESLTLSESREAGYFYLLNIETGEKTSGIWSDGFLIDVVAPYIDAKEGETYYAEYKEVTIRDKNLSLITINDEKYTDFNGGIAKLELSSENGVKVYEIVITDLAGNVQKLKFIVASEWVEAGCVPSGESVSLISDYEYKLGEGNWQLEGDETNYNGNISFYVPEEGEYIFNMQ